LEGGDLAIDVPLDEARDSYITLQHGLTELHLANNLELPEGQERYGKLILGAVQFVLDAWQKARGRSYLRARLCDE
jgi:hypothetical protein